MTSRSTSPTEDVAGDRRRMIARAARALGLTMAAVRELTVADYNAMREVIDEERVKAAQMAQARKRRPALRRGRH